MTTELFADLPESPSPKLAWMRANAITTFLSLPDDPDARLWMAGCNPDGLKPYDFFAKELAANGNMLIGEGETEEDAIHDYCAKTGTPHYSLPQ